MIEEGPIGCTGSFTGAMQRPRGLDGVGLAAAHLEAAAGDRALDEQAGRLDSERLQEVRTMQCRGLHRSTRHLEEARAREEDAALNHMIGDKSAKRSGGG